MLNKKGEKNPLSREHVVCDCNMIQRSIHYMHSLINTSIITTPLTWVWQEGSRPDFQQIMHVNCFCSGGDLWGFVRPNSWMRKLKLELFFIAANLFMSTLFIYALLFKRLRGLFLRQWKVYWLWCMIFECTFEFLVHCVSDRRFSTTKYDMFSPHEAV